MLAPSNSPCQMQTEFHPGPTKHAMTEVLTHLWQEQGLGKAPFRALCIISVPSKSLCEANPEAYNNAWRECSQQARALGVELCSCQSCGMLRYQSAARVRWSACHGWRGRDSWAGDCCRPGGGKRACLFRRRQLPSEWRRARSLLGCDVPGRQADVNRCWLVR